MDEGHENETGTPLKCLTMIDKPSVLCPFTGSYATIDRCKKCNNFKGIDEDKLICKWPY
jgi:hypothetical protein